MAKKKMSTKDKRKGVALVETAILCLFLYVPVLMMVIIWGDLTLDKERAQAASAYTAFNSDRPEERELIETFFPGATGIQDPTQSIRNVELLQKQTEQLQFHRPGSRGGDYSGPASEHEYDLQYKLYSLGAGEFHIYYELQTTPEGGVEYVPRWEHSGNYVSQYLTDNEIVDVGSPSSQSETGSQGQTIELNSASNSRDYNKYVDILTELFNGSLLGRNNPAFISTSALETQLNSPYLSRLEESPRSDEKEFQLPDRIIMRFAPEGSNRLSNPEDTSFFTGFTYLKNPNARPGRAEDIRQNLFESTQYVTLGESANMFRDEENSTEITIDKMPPGISDNLTDSPDHQFLVNSGDPRFDEQ